MIEEKTDFGRLWTEEGNGMRWSLYIYDDEPEIAYLAGVFVDEGRRGTGLGNDVLRKAEVKAVSEGCSIIRLWCKDQGFAWKWYTRHGYMYICDKEDEPGMVWMEKKLGLNEMAYPETFSMEEFKRIGTFSGRVNYCRARLRQMGRGSSRMVFEIDDDKVLKLAYNSKGIAQNMTEADPTFRIYGIFAEVYDVHPKYHWIEMEKAVPAKISDFDKIYGGKNGLFSEFFTEWKYDMEVDLTKGGVFKEWLSPYVFHEFLRLSGNHIGDAWDGIYNAFEDTEEYEGSLFEGLKQYILDMDLHACGDLRRISSYGVVERDGRKEIVLIDYGLNNDVFNKYYARRRVK